MAKEFAIEIRGLSKVYRLYDRPIDRLKEALLPFHRRYSRDFYALKDIDLSIKKGETVGFIGQNGAGKSTLLKVITGVLTPTSGTIEVNGRIASLLELGAGFNPEMTGVENIYMNGVVMGLSREEMDDKVDDIIAFADIGDFINQPVKMYSSGMFARVAFAVNAFVEPDILIVDEALSVGDAFFQAKCMDRMKHMLDDGVTVLFVSHDVGAVRSLCRRGIFMEHGQVCFDGSGKEAIEKYFAAKIRSEQTVLTSEFENGEELASFNLDGSGAGGVWYGNNDAFLEKASYDRTQNGKVELLNVRLLDMDGKEINQVKCGQKVCLRYAFQSHADISVLGFAYHIRSANGVEIVYSDNGIDRLPLFSAKTGGCYVLDWKFRVNLQEGNYNIASVISIPIDIDIGKVEFCDFVPCAVQFSVITDTHSRLYGYVHWDNEVSMSGYSAGKGRFERICSNVDVSNNS